VMDVKMAGAWNLHTTTLDVPLELFVCFSSYSAVIGAPKQANYDAGNNFLDALCHYRSALGLPALAIDWGAILGAGFVERNKKTADYLGKIGLSAFAADEAIAVLSQMLLLDPTQVTAIRVKWPALLSLCPAVSVSSTFSALAQESRSADAGGDLAARLQAANPEARPRLIEDFIASQVAGVFGITPDKIDRETPLTHLGLDSLMAIELKNRIEKDAGITLPITEIMHGPNLSQLALVVLKHIGLVEGEEPVEPVDEISADRPEVEEVEQTTQILGKIDDLSERQIDVLLAQMDPTDDNPFPSAGSSMNEETSS
jgi:acyl carrier protein